MTVPVEQSPLCETCGMTEDRGNHSVYPPTHPFKSVAPSQSVEEARKAVLMANARWIDLENDANFEDEVPQRTPAEKRAALNDAERAFSLSLNALIEAVRGEHQNEYNLAVEGWQQRGNQHEQALERIEELEEALRKISIVAEDSLSR